MSPVLKFKNIVTRVGDFDGSYEYLAINQGSSPDSRGWFVARHVKHIPLSDMDHTIHYDESNAKVVTLINFDSGYKLNIKLWFTYYTDPDAGIIDGLTFKAVMRSPGGVETTPSGYQYGGIYPSPAGSGHYFHSTEAIVKQFGVKAVLCTMYEDVPYQSGIIEGVTEATRLYMRLFAPVVSDELPVNIRSWAQIVNNAVLNDNLFWNPDQPSYLYYPKIFTHPDQSAGVGTIFSYSDLSVLTSESGSTSAPYETGDPEEPTDPSQEDDPSGPGGGTGNYDPTSDPVDFPSLPTGGALSSGAIKAFLVSPSIMQSVFNVLWDSSIFDIPLQFQKLVDNPMDCLISFHCIPVIPSTSGNGNIKLGNLDTQTVAPIINNQYLTIDCGSLNIKEFWGSALDYSPYTKVELYMPFIGIRELKIEDVMKSTNHIKYNIDIFTGDCLCNVKCGQSVLYKFAGNLKQDIPVSGRTNNMGIKGMLGAMTAFAGGMMGGAVGGPVGAAMGVGATLSAAASVASSKITTSRSGSLSGSVGLLDDFVPFFIFHRPVQSLANNFKGHKGYPSNITRQLSNVSGYTEVEYINLQNIPNATDSEMEEIKSLLGSGVLI